MWPATTFHLNSSIGATLSAAVGRAAFCITRFRLPLVGATAGAELVGDVVRDLSVKQAEAVWQAFSCLHPDPDDGRSYRASELLPPWRSALADPELLSGHTDLLFVWLRLNDERVGLAGVARGEQDPPFCEGDRHRLESISAAASNMLALQYRCDEFQRREIVTRAIPALAGAYCVVDEDCHRIVWLSSIDDTIPEDEIWAHQEQVVEAIEQSTDRTTEDQPVCSYPKLGFGQIVRIVGLGSQPMFGSERCSAVALTATAGVSDALSPREKQIAALLLAGYTTINVSAILSISENTIRTYVRRLYRKLNVVSRVDLARKCASSYDMVLPATKPERYSPRCSLSR